MNKYLTTLGLTGALNGCYDQPEKQPVICYERNGIVVPQKATDDRYVLVQRGDVNKAREFLGCDVLASPLPPYLAVRIAQIERELKK